MWFFATICVAVLASVIVIWARIESRKEKIRLEEGKFSAEDFDIFE
jgi:hypothetical protein